MNKCYNQKSRCFPQQVVCRPQRILTGDELIQVDEGYGGAKISSGCRLRKAVEKIEAFNTILYSDMAEKTKTAVEKNIEKIAAIEKQLEGVGANNTPEVNAALKPIVEELQSYEERISDLENKNEQKDNLIQGLANELNELLKRIEVLEKRPEVAESKVELERAIIHAEKNGTNVRTFELPAELANESVDNIKKHLDIFVNGVRQKTDSDENHYELTVENGVATATLNLDTFNPEEDCVYAVISYIKKAEA